MAGKPTGFKVCLPSRLPQARPWQAENRLSGCELAANAMCRCAEELEDV
jgi:hypothetical protein